MRSKRRLRLIFNLIDLINMQNVLNHVSDRSSPLFGPGAAWNVPTVIIRLYTTRQKLLNIQTCRKFRAATRLVTIRSQFYLLTQ